MKITITQKLLPFGHKVVRFGGPQVANGGEHGKSPEPRRVVYEPPKTTVARLYEYPSVNDIKKV